MVGKKEISTLRYSNRGGIYCAIGSGETKPNTLRYSNRGGVWYGVHGGATTTTIRAGNIKKVSKVNWGYIKKVTTVEGW
jgi:hypothetical protein